VPTRPSACGNPSPTPRSPLQSISWLRTDADEHIAADARVSTQPVCACVNQHALECPAELLSTPEPLLPSSVAAQVRYRLRVRDQRHCGCDGQHTASTTTATLLLLVGESRSVSDRPARAPGAKDALHACNASFRAASQSSHRSQCPLGKAEVHRRAAYRRRPDDA
jgi:hypothetical protein